MTAFVREVLEDWSRAVMAKDLDAALALWTDDGIFAGNSEGELATGPHLPLYLAALFASDQTIGWFWQRPLVHQEGDVAWFYADGTLLLDDTRPRPYRASGVLRCVDGTWRLAMFAGAEPS